MLLTEPRYTYLGDAALLSAELIPQPQMSSTIDSVITTEAQNQTAAAPIVLDQPLTETLVLLAVRLKETESMPKASILVELVSQSCTRRRRNVAP